MPLSLGRRVLSYAAVVALFGSPGLSAAPAAGGGHRADDRSGDGAVVETVAGPGFCPTPARLDPSSTQVGSIAVGSDGLVFFDAGRPRDGVIVRVAPDASSRKLVSGPRTHEPGSRPAGRKGAGRKAETGGRRIAETGGGRIAPDGQGGVLVAQGTRLVVIDQGNGLTTIAGDPGRPGPSSAGSGSGDGGPAKDARFKLIHGITTDPEHNVYVADAIDAEKGTFRIRFINRSTEPVVFYPGTDAELMVASGSIETVAGAVEGRGAAGKPSPGAAGKPSPGAAGKPSPGAAGQAPPGAAGQPLPGTGGARVSELAGAPPAMAAADGRLYLAVTPGASSATARRSEVSVINFAGDTVSIHGIAVAAGAIEAIGHASSGTPGAGPQGVDGKADFGYFPGIGVDDRDNLLLADRSNHRVLRIDTDGRMTVLAGTGRRGDAGDYGPARRARLDSPFDVKAGPAGRIYVSDAGNRRIRVIDGAGDIRPAPGNGVANVWRCAPFAQESGSAGRVPRRVRPLAEESGPAGVASDSHGNVYFSLAFSHQIKKFDPSGRVTTVAGGGVSEGSCPPGRICPGFGGDGGPARAAQLASPTALAVSPAGNLYVLDSGNARVRLINLGSKPISVHGTRVAPGAIETVAGNGTVGPAGDGGPARKAQLGTLASGAFSAVQNFLKLPLTTDFSPDLSLGALAADSSGNLYLADSGYAGLAYASFVKIDASNHRVRKVDAKGTISTFAGQGAPPGRDLCCADPTGLAVDSSGNLYVSDRGAAPEGTLPSAGLAANTDPTRRPRVWVVNPGPRPVAVLGQKVEPNEAAAVVGDGRYGFGGDGGPATRAQLLLPSALALRPNGEMFVAEYGTAETGDVRHITPDGRIIRIAGSGQSGFNGDGLRALLTSLHFPVALAFDACGDLLLADLGNDRVRRVDLETSCPAAGRPSPLQRSPWPGGGAVFAVVAFVVAAAGVLYLKSRRANHAKN